MIMENNKIKTYLEEIDSNLKDGALTRGQVYAIGGRPGSGKTVLLKHIAFHNAKNNKKVLFFNLEMAEDLLINTFLSEEADIDLSKIIQDKLEDYEREDLKEAISRFDGLNKDLIIKSSDKIQLTELIDTISHEKNKGSIDLIVIDYLQCIYTENGDTFQDKKYIEILNELNTIAKKLDAVVVLNTQVNRQCETRDDKMPTIADVKEFEGLDRIVAGLFMVTRPYYYNQYEIKNLETINQLEVDIAKNRFGSTGRKTVGMNPYRSKLYNIRANKKTFNIEVYIDDKENNIEMDNYGDVWEVISNAVENEIYMNGSVRFKIKKTNE